MFRIGFFSIALLGIFGVAQAELPAESVQLWVDWKLNLDENGKVVALAVQPGRAKEALREVLESAILEWEFEPGAINGKPTETETNLLVTVSVSPADDGESVKVRVDKVQTGGNVANITKLPYFPPGQVRKAWREKVNPLVMLMVTYDATGKPEEVVLMDESPAKDRALVSQAISAVETWVFSPERVGGHGIRARAMVPICFTANVDKDGHGDCNVPASGHDSPMSSGQSIALDSEVRLKSDVVGREL